MRAYLKRGDGKMVRFNSNASEGAHTEENKNKEGLGVKYRYVVLAR